MERDWSKSIMQFIYGVNKYRVDSMTDLSENKDKIKLGRNGSLFYCEGNYSFNLSSEIETKVLIVPFANGTMVGNVIFPADGIVSQFGVNLELPVKVSPELILNQKIKNTRDKVYILNPLFLYLNIKSSYMNLIKSRADFKDPTINGIPLVDFGIQIGKKRKSLDSFLSFNPSNI